MGDKFDKELTGLLSRVNLVYTQSGGADTGGARKAPSRGGDRFSDTKSDIVATLHRIHQQHDQVEALTAEGAERVKIARLQHEIRTGIQDVKGGIAMLKKLIATEVSKRRSKFSPEELERRKLFIKQLEAQLRHAQDPHASPESKPEFGELAPDITAWVAGGGVGAGPPMMAPRGAADVEMTEYQMTGMKQIKREEEEIDGMVDQIGEGVGKLHEIALAMKDELDVHDVVIGEVTEKADKAKSQLDTVNKKLKKTLDTVNSSGDKFCVNVICLVLLLGILTVIYNMVTKNSS
jgi:hypothetical protein